MLTRIVAFIFLAALCGVSLGQSFQYGTSQSDLKVLSRAEINGLRQTKTDRDQWLATFSPRAEKWIDNDNFAWSGPPSLMTLGVGAATGLKFWYTQGCTVKDDYQALCLSSAKGYHDRNWKATGGSGNVVRTKHWLNFQGQTPADTIDTRNVEVYGEAGDNRATCYYDVTTGKWRVTGSYLDINGVAQTINVNQSKNPGQGFAFTQTCYRHNLPKNVWYWNRTNINDDIGWSNNSMKNEAIETQEGTSQSSTGFIQVQVINVDVQDD